MITLPENQHLCLILRIHLEGCFWQRPINTFSCCRGLLHVFSVLHSHCTAEMLIACPWSPAGSADPENSQYQAHRLPCAESFGWLSRSARTWCVSGPQHCCRKPPAVLVILAESASWHLLGTPTTALTCNTWQLDTTLVASR